MYNIAISSDEKTPLTEAIISLLNNQGHILKLFGAISFESPDDDWPVCSAAAAKEVASGSAEMAIVCCWTGTGATLAANKIKGIRAALCGDVETAKGARIWNHANVLGLSLRSTSIPMMNEIVNAFLSTPLTCPEAQTEWNLQQIELINALESNM